MNADQAFRAVLHFLNGYWERAGRPDEVGAILTFCHYTPGRGTADPAMWFDWLAQVKRVQTGEVVPDQRRSTLTAEMTQPLDAEQAHLAMFQFIEEYWNRVKHPADLGSLLGHMRYTKDTGAAEPLVWKDWLAAVEAVSAL